MADTTGTDDPATSAAATHLPAKLWERIFLLLSPLQVLRVRAVCSHWCRLVTASPELMDRYAGVLTGERTVLPVGCLQLAGFRITGCGSWWDGYGRGLTELRLNGCSLEVGVLYGLLKQTPNLKRLEINDSGFAGTGRPEFRLDKLEGFAVDNPGNRQLPNDLIRGVERVFPKLKELRFMRRVEVSETSLMESIRALRGTLECLELIEGKYVEMICRVDGLQLKEFSGYVDFSSIAWKLFCRKQPGIEKLLVMADSCQKLRNIGRAMPNLKCLPLDLTSSMKADFLNDMKNLENIDFNGHLHALDFRSAANPKLNHFHMINTTATKLIQYLRNAPDLRHINMHECTLIGDSPQPQHFPNLRTLILSKCKLPPNLTLNLILANPQLTTLQLRFLPTLTDQQFAQICETVGFSLRKLAVIQCGQLTDLAGEYIMRCCRALELLQFHGFSLSPEGSELLQERHVRIKRWFWPYCNDPVGGFAPTPQ